MYNFHNTNKWNINILLHMEYITDDLLIIIKLYINLYLLQDCRYYRRTSKKNVNRFSITIRYD